MSSSLGIASRLINSCLLHVSEVSKLKRKRSKHHSLLDELGRFKLWAHGFEVIPSQLDGDDVLQRPRYSTEPPKLEGDPEAVNSQLDEVLERSEYLKEPTIMLLSSLASCLLTSHFKKGSHSILSAGLDQPLY